MKVDGIEIKQDKITMAVQAELNQRQVNWTIENMHRGHTLWEINNETGDISPAKFDDGTDISYATMATKKKVRQQKDCVYIPALNIKNAVKKWYKKAQKLL